MKKSLILISLIASLVFTNLVSCKSDDPDAGGIYTKPDEGLVEDEIPVEGWSDIAADGVITYMPDSYDSYDDYAGYYAFEMKEGICQSGVYNLVMPSAQEARMMAEMLNSGSWAAFDDDDDEWYGSRRRSLQGISGKLILNGIEKISSIFSTRASLYLPIPVQREGRVLYMVIPNIKGLTIEELRTVMDVWSGNYTDIPDHVLFGTYENGVYTCSNMRGMNIRYVVTTEFNDSGLCTKYTTSITLPTEGWAQLYYASYEEQLDDFENQFGRRPELTIEGTTVILDALILGDVTRYDIDTMIYALDWLNNCPFLYSLFG